MGESLNLSVEFRLRSFAVFWTAQDDARSNFLKSRRVGAVEPFGADVDGWGVAEPGRGRGEPHPYNGRVFVCRGVDGGEDGVDLGAVGGEGADWVGGGGVAGEEQGLAAAAAEVESAAIACVAWSLHPGFAAEFLEGIASVPDFGKRLVFHVGKLQAGDDFCGVTGKCFAARRDEHELAAPATHAGLGIFCVVIGNDGLDADFAAEAFFGSFDLDEGLIELHACGQQAVAIGEAPTVVLHIGKFDAGGARGFGDLEHFVDLIDVAAVNDEIKRDRDANLF